MESRREQKQQWIAHLPDLPNTGQKGWTNTAVVGGDEELITEQEGPQEGEEISPRQAGMSIDPLMVEAIRIYKTYIWGCKNLSWLFSEGVPEWLDTDPTEWHAVRKILQEFNHHDFIKQFTRVEKEVDTKQPVAYYTEFERNDACAFPAVTIVCLNDSSQNLKSCLKVQGDGHLASSIIKMVVVGSIDIELFALTEAEIDWKSIPLSLERVEVNGRYIRDISKREMDVRKLYELDLYTIKTLDGDDLTTVESRRELCELYNQKLRVQLAEYSVLNMSELTSGDEVLKQSGKISKLALLNEVKNKVIPPHKSTKHTMIDRIKEANPAQPRSGQSTCDGRGGNTARSLTIVTKTGEYDKPNSKPIVTFPAEYHTDDLLTVARKMEAPHATSTRHNSERSVETFDDFLNDCMATMLQNKKETHREITSPFSEQSLDDLLSQNKAIKQGNKTNDNRQILPSSSAQSLDDLLNEALEAEEELERRRAEKSSTKIKSPPIQESGIAKLQIVNEGLVKEEQSFQSFSGRTISSMDNCVILTIPQDTAPLNGCKEATANAPYADFASQHLHIAKKQGENTSRIQASSSLQSKEPQRTFRSHKVPVLQGETPFRTLTQNKFSGEKTEYCERPQSRRGCPVPVESYRQIPIKCSLDNEVQETDDLKKDLPPSRCWSNLSLFSELSADDWVLLHQRNLEQSKSVITSIPGVNISGQERSHETSPDRADCRHLTIPQERIGDNRRLHFFRRHLSSFRRKLRQFNCFSKT